jgi:septal ring factor EnvC (AmiA/AmiB activator)
MRISAALVAAGLVWASPLAAQAPRDIQASLVRAASLVQEIESLIQARETRIARLSAELAAKEVSLDQARAELGEVLAALHRLARRPRELALFAAANPREAVHRAQLLAAAWSAIEQRAHDLRGEIESVERLQISHAEEQRALGSTLAQLAAERAALDELLSQRARGATRSNEATSERLARLAREARDLRDFIQRLETGSSLPPLALRPPSGAVAGAPRFTGLGRLPVVGTTTLGFGAPTASGQPHRGILIEAKPRAPVVSSAAGRVAFAGPFRLYGLILIIDHGGGYHTLLMGLGRIDTAAGQWVGAGEPVGLLADGDGTPSSLYVELRRKGQPIDPLPWLAARKEKENG